MTEQLPTTGKEDQEIFEDAQLVMVDDSCINDILESLAKREGVKPENIKKYNTASHFLAELDQIPQGAIVAIGYGGPVARTTGIDVARKVREKGRTDLRIIIMSGIDIADEVKKAKKLNIIDGFSSKPNGIDTIMELIRDLLKKV